MNLHSTVSILLLSVSGAYAQTNSTGTSLGNGFLITRTPVDTHAMLALDVNEMTDALNQNDLSTARDIYMNGRNSQKFDADGNPTVLRTLQGFSTAANSGKFDDEPAFLYHTYGIAGGDANAAKNEYTYADQYVQQLLNDSSSGTLAAEAVVALNIWMYVAHELYDGLNDCRSAETSSASQVRGLEDNGLGVHAIDEAMAFWIGADQEVKAGTGYSMFEVAQQAEFDFGTSGAGSSGYVAPANTKLKNYYEQARTILAISDRCYPNSGTTEQLYHITNKMISVMMIPLVQKLIDAIVNEDDKRIKLYALSVVPQIAACKPTTADYLMSKLYLNSYDKSDRSDVLQQLQSAYPCLGFTCSDIGPYKTNVIGQCADPPNDLALAGYSPATAGILTRAMIDLDILQIKILTRMGSFSAARELYELGKNSVTSTKSNQYHTLKSYANVKDRSLASPFFEMFSDYNSAANYAHLVVDGALMASGRYATMSVAQRSEFVFKTLQYQVMYMYAMTEFFRSVGYCRNPSSSDDDIQHSWDKGVAFIVGSIEGPFRGGADTDDGMLLYNLANKRCEQFGTCDLDGMAQIIKYYEELFTAGKDAAAARDCDSLDASATKLGHYVMVPVMQGVMRYALKNNKLSTGSDSKDLAEGEVFAMSVLPMIDTYDDSAADVIEKNLIIQSGVQPVQDGPQAVADALYQVVDDFGIECTYIGEAGGVSVCPGGVQSARGAGGVGKVQVSSIAVLAAVLVGMIA